MEDYRLTVPTVAPFGFWPSPLTALDAAAGKASLSELCSDGASLYWLESRPADGGRVVFVRAIDGGVIDLSPDGVNIRSRVHEYGGGAVCLIPGHGVAAFAFVDMADQRVWWQGGNKHAPAALTAVPPDGQRWFHGGLSTSADGDWLLAVREVHRAEGMRPERILVAIGLRAEAPSETVVVRGHDFYGTPRLHPSGERLAVVAWDHPDMPWDASSVVVVPLQRLFGEDGAERLSPAGEPWVIAGGGNESVGQPTWLSDGGLLFTSDRQGWWQPYRQSGLPDGSSPIPLTDEAAEFHGPDFVLGLTTMAELADGSLVARRTEAGRDALVVLPPVGAPRVVEQPCRSISAVCAHGEGLAFIGSPPDGPPDVWISPDGHRPAARLRSPRRLALSTQDVAVGQPFALIGHSGRPVYGSFYPPTLQGTTGPAGSLPPLVVWCHGGPTSSASCGFDSALQFFTSRGVAVATVDYAGSSGYGRDYRCSLWGQWGAFDSEDCVDAAQHLTAQGVVDPERLAIRGASAGGFTALNALASGGGFRAATAWFGVTDLLSLAASSHDFEAHYLDRLVGTLPESRATYVARSPVHRAAELNGAILLLQGMNDAVVPPSQAVQLQSALSAAGRQCEVRYFEGEGHGFRRAETLVACLETELAFYRATLDL